MSSVSIARGFSNSFSSDGRYVAGDSKSKIFISCRIGVVSFTAYSDGIRQDEI